PVRSGAAAGAGPPAGPSAGASGVPGAPGDVAPTARLPAPPVDVAAQALLPVALAVAQRGAGTGSHRRQAAGPLVLPQPNGVHAPLPLELRAPQRALRSLSAPAPAVGGGGRHPRGRRIL